MTKGYSLLAGDSKEPMSDDTDGRLNWLHWPTVLKGLALGVGAGLILAVSLEDFYLGMLLGTLNGLAFGIGWSHSRA